MALACKEFYRKFHFVSGLIIIREKQSANYPIINDVKENTIVIRDNPDDQGIQVTGVDDDGSVFEAEPNRLYRFRIVGWQSSQVRFSLEDGLQVPLHFTLIAMDGVNQVVAMIFISLQIFSI